MLNRIRVQLDMGSHPSKQLQGDWEADGEDAFDFEVVDLLTASDDPGHDISDDLTTLLELWQERLQIDSTRSY
jgi:hypothetical protein